MSKIMQSGSCTIMLKISKIGMVNGQKTTLVTDGKGGFECVY